ncbi:aspartate--tRNA(Asn) ligase [Candidatus Pacearchaeota archaeon ex4484_26]|mgnify:CR=1 FL=1|nr:MAG: aspartate--tRNA(Asn) ligase [Candidatus Pacearchaeota archaeon ex4484_26]RLF35902.1 MAG: aspartate--tRNA(Asn) ligase [Thermoplasmata archaeon]
MKRWLVKEVSKEAGKTIMLKGWVHELRDLAKIKFILLRDSSGIIQCVVKDKKLFKEFAKLTLETVVQLEGKVRKAKIKSEQALKNVEVEVSKIKILNKAEKLPILVNEKTITTGLSKRLDYRTLDIRKPKINAIFKIQSTIAHAFREFFYNQGFTEIQTPGIISSASEGGTELFPLQYFEKKAYLAQSPQLYKQLIAISLEKVFLTIPVWRAEKHNTTRHLNEVLQLDIEVAFADEFVVMKYLEEVVRYIVKKVLQENKKELEILGIKLQVPKAKYLTYKEAIKVLQRHNIKIKYGDDLEPEAEKKLCKIYKGIVFVYEWPQTLKPFYIWPKDKVSGGFDALYEGIEIASGGQRIHIPEILIKQLKSKGLNPKDFKWYIDAFRYGAPKHAGWSIGLERLTMAICKLDNIREACLFPRDRERITP